MATVNSLQIINNLGEITRHRDRVVIEKSLLKTLAELAPHQKFRLFKVLTKEGEEAVLELLAHSLDDKIETSGFDSKEYELTPTIKQLVLEVIESTSVKQWLDAETKLSYIVYPTLDQHNEVFAILVHVSGDKLEPDVSRFVYGLLKVYSNYLALIDDNQRDKLTQLLNRDTMDREISRILLSNNELRLAKASGLALRRVKDKLTYWLGVLDIDHFKAVNDNFGHLFGDDVLILIARQMQQDINGENDLLYRYGGEEFVIILQAPDFTAAHKIFDQLRSNIAQHDFPQVGRVTVSIGIVQVTHQTGSTEVIGQADQALYYVKEHGRNRVCCYEQLLEDSLIQHATQQVTGGELEFF